MTGTCRKCGMMFSVPDVLGMKEEETFRNIGMQFSKHVQSAHPETAHLAATNGAAAWPLINGYTLMRQMKCSDVRFSKGLGLCRTAIVELLESAGVFEDEDAAASRKPVIELEPDPRSPDPTLGLNDTQELPPFPGITLKQ